jgi:hypothetical protein
MLLFFYNVAAGDWCCAYAVSPWLLSLVGPAAQLVGVQHLCCKKMFPMFGVLYLAAAGNMHCCCCWLLFAPAAGVCAVC